MHRMAEFFTTGTGTTILEQEDTSPVDATAPDSYGFVPVIMPTNIRENTIVIFAPENCTSDEAALADELSEQLTERGIPNVMEDHYEVTTLSMKCYALSQSPHYARPRLVHYTPLSQVEVNGHYG